MSKHTAPVTSLCCNKTVFTVSGPELMRLNDWLSLSAEMKQISCSENLQSFVTETEKKEKVTASEEKLTNLII